MLCQQSPEIKDPLSVYTTTSVNRRKDFMQARLFPSDWNSKLCQSELKVLWKADMERLHAGWLVKSPPGKKTVGPWRLFKSKWRQRYFVLYAPPSSTTIPGCCSAVLCYYEDDTMMKEYGRIDLNHCEEILTQLESDEHRNVFALRTVSKDSERTYYLAADTEEDMNQWAACLCCVLRLSGGDGITLSSGFGRLSPYADGLQSLNRQQPRCSILTQRTGEQTRLSNVPETISKSASVLNIRVASEQQHQQQPQASSNTLSKAKGSQNKGGKRQSILSLVVKPAANSSRRPSCPSLPLSVQNRLQTQPHALPSTPGKLPNFPPNGKVSTSDDFHSPSFNLDRPVPKFQFEPPTPMAILDPFAHGISHMDQEDRWRFESSTVQQCPPALPTRVTRSSSSVQHREGLQRSPRCYRNSMENWQPRDLWRDSEMLDEDLDEESREPDYDLPKLNYDNACGGQESSRFDNDSLQHEASEEDREEDYSYPQYHYNMEGPDGQLQSPRSTVEKKESGVFEDSYDYLPGCRRATERSSTARSSAGMSDEHGIYDILPKRGSSFGEPSIGSRMSGLESSGDDSSSIYQNDVFNILSADGCDRSPLQQTPNQSHVDPVPPIPEKKGQKEERTMEKRRSVPPPPPPPPPSASASSDAQEAGAHCYINHIDVTRDTKDSTSSSSQDENVYLPMAGAKTSDTIYTLMHSPVNNISDHPTVAAEERSGRLKETNSPDGPPCSSLQPKRNRPPPETAEAGHQNLSSTPSLIPIRFTVNTRSFKRKIHNRESADMKSDPSSQLKFNENHEPSVNMPPPLPPKNLPSKAPNYLHYASLNLETDPCEGKLPSPLSASTPPGAGCFQTDTLYRLIDAEKTKALQELKKQMDDRQRFFANLSPEH